MPRSPESNRRMQAGAAARLAETLAVRQGRNDAKAGKANPKAQPAGLRGSYEAGVRQHQAATDAPYEDAARQARNAR